MTLVVISPLMQNSDSHMIIVLLANRQVFLLGRNLPYLFRFLAKASTNLLLGAIFHVG